LDWLTSLDDKIHELIDDREYDADLQKCEEYIEAAKPHQATLCQATPRHTKP
jgi:hypothetical protein